MRRTIVIAGHGMVGHRLVDELVKRGALDSHRIVVIGEERHPAYDRVHLSSFFDGAGIDDLSLVPDGFFDEPHLSLLTGRRITGIDRFASGTQVRTSMPPRSAKASASCDRASLIRKPSSNRSRASAGITSAITLTYSTARMVKLAGSAEPRLYYCRS